MGKNKNSILKNSLWFISMISIDNFPFFIFVAIGDYLINFKILITNGS